MTKLAFKIALVLLPVVILSIVFELGARSIPTTYSTKVNYLRKKKNQLEILVMGSSQSNFGINPEFFGREAFNLSNASQCLYQDYEVLLKYLPECKNVKMVIIPISYFSLESDLALSPESWRCAYYSVYMGVQADASQSMFDLRTYSALFLWEGPLGVINGMRKIDEVKINEYGFQTRETDQANIDEMINDETGKKRVAFHHGLMRHSLLDTNISTLVEMADVLNKRNIQLIFVITPVYKTYYQHITKGNYELMTNAIDKIVNKHSAKSFNYFYDSRFELGDFWDNDHLNAKGAKKFSIILKNEVIDKLM